MNLTWELRQGSVGRWARRTLADVEALDPSWRAAVASASTRRPHSPEHGGPDWRTLGRAIHQRVAFGFAADPPVVAFHGLELVAGGDTVGQLVEAYQQGRSAGATPTPSSGAQDFAGRLGQFVARYDLATIQLAAVERTLARALWVLSLWESTYRGDEPTWWPGPDAATWSGADWLGVAPEYAVADLAAVAQLFTGRGRHDLLTAAGSNDVVVGPIYAPDWADADLKLGSCLIEVKATVHPGRLNPLWIWQLCCYAWLDGHVDAIAIHLPRQGRTVAMDLTATVETISGGGDAAVIAGQGRAVMREAAASVGKPIP